MPFELGLVVALQRKWMWMHSHQWYVFEAKAHRAEKSLSDIKGTEIFIHEGKPLGVLRQLSNLLIRRREQPTLVELQAILRELNEVAVRTKKELHIKSLFEPRVFVDLVNAAIEIARRRVVSLPRLGR
jgi:hypothetical protein